MSTSLLYHAFGIRGYHYVKTAYEGGEVIFTIGQDHGGLRCGACGSPRMTIRDVAEHLQVGWDLVKDIQHRYLSRKFRRIKLTHLRQIAIDEIAIGRGQRYLTVVLDVA